MAVRVPSPAVISLTKLTKLNSHDSNYYLNHKLTRVSKREFGAID
jgi:hypothetical protein